nr:TetR/AcrR family transcriptional regulator [Hoyosella altamirensis]
MSGALTTPPSTPTGRLCYFLAVQPDSETDSQSKRSFIEEARRAQIIDAAITTIADSGYSSASMAQIAKTAGISRGLISYHFANKDELIAQVVIKVYTDAGEYIGARVSTESTPAEQLREYIASNLDYMAVHPKGIIALVEIFSSGALANLPGIDASEGEEQSIGPVVEVLARGQQLGQFADFNPRFMAQALRNVIDGVSPHLSDPQLDLEMYKQEIITMFERATGAQRPSEEVPET